jgi:hypothetical protein
MVYQCHALPLEPDVLSHYSSQLGLTTEQAIEALSEAVALHPGWQGIPQGMLVWRTQPTPCLAVIGIIPSKSLRQLDLQQAALNSACQRLRYVTYAEAEIACESLATQLIERFGLKALSGFRFCGIPRGGLIVLGMLSYALGLSHDQMTPPYPEEVPLAVVDDCALSGSRFARTLQQYPRQDLIFAPLYSHPDLRRNLTETEPQVLHCLSGQDLVDHGPNMMGAEYGAWQVQNQERLKGRRYWLGLPDYLCFPWNEPDHLLWNPLTQKLEESWHIVPPAYCLKNQPGVSFTVQRQPCFEGWLQPTAQTIFGSIDRQVLIGNLSTQETFGLSGRAAEFWWTLSSARSLEDAIASLARSTHEPELTELKIELTNLIEELLTQNILVAAH